MNKFIGSNEENFFSVTLENNLLTNKSQYDYPEESVLNKTIISIDSKLISNNQDVKVKINFLQLR